MTAVINAPAELYVFNSASDVQEERARLDELHEAIAAFMGQRLHYAPLEHTNPKRILEVGSGSGAWAVQAAQMFPESEVIAVDITPLPSRFLPSNLGFHHVDITKPLPFADEIFDVVHIRLVIMHLPNGEDALKRIMRLVKPGGWLLVDDSDTTDLKDHGSTPGPGMAAFLEMWISLLRSRGAEPSIGRQLDAIIRSTGHFDEVNVTKVDIPMSQQSSVEAENDFGRAWVNTVKRVISELPRRFESLGITDVVIDRYFDELDDPTRKITTSMYFTWSRKALN